MDFVDSFDIILMDFHVKSADIFGIIRFFFNFIFFRNFLRKKYFLLKSFLFWRYDRVESFKALSRWKTPPNEKDPTYFVRAIFEIFTFGDSRHPKSMGDMQAPITVPRQLLGVCCRKITPSARHSHWTKCVDNSTEFNRFVQQLADLTHFVNTFC